MKKYITTLLPENGEIFKEKGKISLTGPRRNSLMVDEEAGITGDGSDRLIITFIFLWRLSLPHTLSLPYIYSVRTHTHIKPAYWGDYKRCTVVRAG